MEYYNIETLKEDVEYSEDKPLLVIDDYSDIKISDDYKDKKL